MSGDAAKTIAGMPPASADICLSIFGALSFSPPGPLLTAAARVLRPGGTLAITLRADDHHDYVTILTHSSATRLRPIRLAACLTTLARQGRVRGGRVRLE